MKLLSFFGLVFLLCSAFRAGAQSPLDVQVHLALRNADLETALNALAEKAEVSISFSSELLPAKRVSGKYLRQPVRIVLDDILAHTGLSYRVIGTQVVVYRMTLAAERRFTISGFLYDASSGEPLIGAYIREKRTEKLTASNEYGFFSLTLSEGPVSLRFSYLGYEGEDSAFELRRDTVVVANLRGAILLKEVVIKAPPAGTVSSATKIAPLGPDEAELMPALGGEPDIVRSLHLLPGVQTGTDGIEGMLVRGGSQGHNLVLIDGVPVYNYSHAAGVLSIFNMAAVRSMRFLKGGFPARYSGRLASVLDIRTKEGNTRAFQGRADIGTLSSRLTLEGPVIRDKSAFFISGRASLVNWYLKPLSRDFKSRQGEQGQTLYQFDDFNAKWHCAFSGKDKVYLSIYRGRDHFKNEGYRPRNFAIFDSGSGETLLLRYDRTYRDAFDWGNTVGSLRWNHVFGNKLFVNTTATYSRLDVNIQYENADSLLLLEPRLLLGRSINVGRYTSGIEERGIRMDADFVPSPDHYWRFGASMANRNFQPGALVYDERSEGQNSGLANAPLGALEFSAYVEDEFRIGDRFMGNAGMHFVNWAVEGRNHTSFQPRLALQWQSTERLRLRAAHSRMAQFLHLLTNSDIGLPTDLWVPSSGSIAPEQAVQNEIGMDFAFRSGFSLEWDLYHKRMNNLLAFTEGASVLNDWRENVTSGEGVAYGTEWMLQYRSEKTTAWLSYGLARTERRFERVNLGRTFPFKYDRRHDLKLAAAHRLKPWLILSANWVLSSGFAYSLPLAEFTFQLPGQATPPVVVPDFGAKNRYRMPWYHRLDMNAQVQLKSRSFGHTFNIGVYNAYNRRNPLYYNLRTQIENPNGQLRETKQFVQVWLIPIAPSLSYSLRF